MNAASMHDRCPDSVKIGNAGIPNFRFAIDSAGVATIIDSPDGYVQGILWLISPMDERRLDIYEGVKAGCYRKEHLSVITNYLEVVKALVYISARPECDPSTHTRSFYMSDIYETAKEAKFRKYYLEKLARYANS
jgi:AIG2-like family.